MTDNFTYVVDIEGNEVLKPHFTGNIEQKTKNWISCVSKMYYHKSFDKPNQEILFLVIENNLPYRVNERGEIFITQDTVNELFHP